MLDRSGAPHNCIGDVALQGLFIVIARGVYAHAQYIGILNNTSRYLTRCVGIAIRVRGASSFVVNAEFEVRLAVFCVT